MHATTTPAPSIRFEGNPTEAERALLAAVVAEVEARRPVPARPSFWVCCCFHFGRANSCYFAHCSRHPVVLTAASAEELAGKIAALP